MSEDEARELAAANPIDEPSCDQVAAMRRARVLLACFPAGKPQDPEVYAMAVSAILADYPESIVNAVTDPRSGIPRNLKFLPAVSEVAEACDQAMADRATLHNLAEQHLRIRHEPGFRDRLEQMVGYSIGRDEPAPNPAMKARIDDMVAGAFRPRQAAE